MPQPCRGPTGGNEQEGGAVDGEKPAHERDQADHPDERGQDVAGVVVAQRQDHTEREQQRGEPGQPRRDGPQQVDRRTHPVHDAGMATRLLRDVTRLPLPQALLIPRDLRTAHLPLIPRRPMSVPPPAVGHTGTSDRVPQVPDNQLGAGRRTRVRSGLPALAEDQPGIRGVDVTAQRGPLPLGDLPPLLDSHHLPRQRRPGGGQVMHRRQLHRPLGLVDVPVVLVGGLGVVVGHEGSP